MGTVVIRAAFPLRLIKALEVLMLRGGLLWLIGIPIPIIILLWLGGFLS